MVIPVIEIKQDSRPPFQIAADIRQQLRNSIRAGTPLRIELNPNIAACLTASLTGASADILRETKLSTLIHSRRDGMTILLANDETTVQEAVQTWYHRGKEDEVARNRFNTTMYLSVYELIQATLLGKGKKQLNKGLTRFFLACLEQESEDEFLVGLAPVIESKGEIPELDQVTLHQTLTSLWGKIPPEIRETYASFEPKNLFKLPEY